VGHYSKVRPDKKEDTVPDREELERRVADLEKQLRAGSGMPMVRYRGIRKRASWGIGDLPWYDIAVGPDLERGEWRGSARGVIAIGDFASGVFALGGLARGVVAFGGLAAGLVSFGGLSVGLLGAIGGLAIGGLAMGGGAVGYVSVGGAAAGYYACGGAAAGEHATSGLKGDPVAEAFFAEHGLPCGPTRRRPRM
jgi:hypothetical protein